MIVLSNRLRLLKCSQCFSLKLLHSSVSLRQEKDIEVPEKSVKKLDSKSDRPNDLEAADPKLPPQPPPKQIVIGKQKSLGIAGELWGHKGAPEEDPPDGSTYDERFYKTRYDTRYTDIMAAQTFMQGGDKDKETFLDKCEQYQKTITKHKHGQVEFIYGALTLMKEYGVHKDLTAYKALMDIFPKEVMKPTNQFQAGFFHFHKQSSCAVDILHKMEYEGVEPDMDMEKLVIDIFSRKSAPWRKIARQIYWFGKFRNANPYPIPENIDNLSALELAKIAIKRMCPDLQTTLTVMSTTQVEDAFDKTWIVSAQSPCQKELIEEMTSDRSLYVEGSYQVWLKDIMLSYFVLKADHRQIEDPEDEDPYDVSDIKMNVFGKSKDSMTATQKDLHKTSDGVILGIAATGTSSRDSVLSWVRLLETTNPKMKTLQTIFKMKAPTTEVETINEASVKNESVNKEATN